MAALSFDNIRDGLGDPSLYPQNLSLPRGQFLFLNLSRPELQAASFLDDRILSASSEGRWTAFNELAPLMNDLGPAHPLHFIFHAGHVGSTLVSRLLDEVAGVLGLREPLPLRVMAEAFDVLGAPSALASEHDARTLLQWCARFWRRGFADTEAVIVKATSSAGRLANPLLDTAPDARAIFLTVKPEPYLATLLAGKNSYIDLRGQGAERYTRLARLGAPVAAPLYDLSLGELAALTWLTETLTSRAAQTQHGARMLHVDFDAFLSDREEWLQRICAHFALPASPSVLARIAASPAFDRYSKAPERAYTPEIRRETLDDSRRRNAEEIRKGLLWLEQAARQSPASASALSA